MIHQSLRADRIKVLGTYISSGVVMARIVLSSGEQTSHVRRDYADVPADRLPAPPANGNCACSYDNIFAIAISVRAEREKDLNPEVVIVAKFEGDKEPRILWDRRRQLLAEGEITEETIVQIDEFLAKQECDLDKCHRYPTCAVNNFTVS